MFERPSLSGGSALTGSIPESVHRNEEFDPIAVWSSFVGILLRRRLLFIVVFVGFVLSTTILTLRTPKEFSTEVKFIAGNPSSQNGQQSQTGLPVLNALLLANSAQSAETYSELIGETPVVQTVMDNLKLDSTLPELKGAIAVKPVTGTNIISLVVRWSDAETSAKIANEFAKVFVDRESQLVSGQANGALEFLSRELPSAQVRLRRATADVTAFEKAHGIADIVGQTSSLVSASATLDARIGAIQVEKKQADAQIASLSDQLRGMQPISRGGQSIAENPLLSQLRSQLAQLQGQLGSARGTYTDEFPGVVTLKQQVAALKRQIANQAATVVSQTNTVANPVYQQLTQQLAFARATSSSDTGELGVLLQQRRNLDRQVSSLPSASAHLAELRRREKVAEELYTALQGKYNDAAISKSTGISDVTVTQPALAELATKTPHVALNLALGGIVGLLLALGAVFIADWFDSRIRSETDVEGELHLPVLAMLPEAASGEHGLSVPDWTLDAESEAYDNLVLEMRYSKDPDKKLHVLTVTSPIKGDGKSTVAMKVASVFGETATLSDSELDTRVLIIDADMRRPSLHIKFGLSNRKGLSDILVGSATLVQCVQRTNRPGVDLLTSGTLSKNPVKLLQSVRFDRLLSEARSSYTAIVVDAPALVPVADAAIAAAKSDGTLMVLSAGQSDIRTTRRAIQRLERIGNADIIGVVMNRAKLRYDVLREYAELPNPVSAEAGDVRRLR